MQRRPGASLLPVFGYTEGVLLMNDIGKDACAQIRREYVAEHAA